MENRKNIFVLGCNGAGKSYLLNILIGQDPESDQAIFKVGETNQPCTRESQFYQGTLYGQDKIFLNVIDVPSLFDIDDQYKESKNEDIPFSIKCLVKLNSFIKEKFDDLVNRVLLCIDANRKWDETAKNLIKIANIMMPSKYRFDKCISFIKDDNFQQLEGDIQHQLININQQIFNQQDIQQQLQQPLDKIEQQLHQIESITKDYQNKNVNTNQIIDFKNRKYSIEVISYSEGNFISSISKNEQYLAFVAYCEKKLKIYDIKKKKIITHTESDYYIWACQFTEDSSQLYAGSAEGYVYGYDVKDNFKEIFKLKIHSSNVFNIITIQNEYLITSSDDQKIIKTDIKCKQEIFKLTSHTGIVRSFDYNYQDDIIVSDSRDQSIKLWDQQSHNQRINQIQLINNNQNILSLDEDYNLYKWKIDLQNKDLIKLQEFRDQKFIFNFYQVNQDQNLILICSDYFKILNQQGETINTIEHGGANNASSLDCKQLDNLNYIQIRSWKRISLAIAQE